MLEASGEPLQMREIILFEPARLRWSCASSRAGCATRTCRSIRGTFPFMFPTVLGHEGSGVIESVGRGRDPCRAGRPRRPHLDAAVQAVLLLPAGQSVLCDVGLAEAIGSSYATVDGVPLVRGLGVAGLRDPHPRARGVGREDPRGGGSGACGADRLRALDRGRGGVPHRRVAPGSTVAVVGCGGVGLSVMQGAKIAGASRIIAVDRLAAKLDLARSLGATDVVDASSVDPVEGVKALTGGRGADYTFEVVGVSATIKQSFAMTRRGGTTRSRRGGLAFGRGDASMRWTCSWT